MLERRVGTVHKHFFSYDCHTVSHSARHCISSGRRLARLKVETETIANNTGNAKVKVVLKNVLKGFTTTCAFHLVCHQRDHTSYWPIDGSKSGARLDRAASLKFFLDPSFFLYVNCCFFKNNNKQKQLYSFGVPILSLDFEPIFFQPHPSAVCVCPVTLSGEAFPPVFLLDKFSQIFHLSCLCEP